MDHTYEGQTIFLEDNIGGNLGDLGLGDKFLDKIHNFFHLRKRLSPG